MTDNTYNGWTNYSTWNVALYIQNDEGLYHMAREYDSYEALAETLNECGSQVTPDGVSWTHPELDTDELDEMLAEL